MALKYETKTIGDNTYEVGQLPYSRGHKVLLRVFKVLGPSIVDAISKAPDLKERELGSLDVGEIAQALAAGAERLAQDLTEADFDYVVDELCTFSFLLRDGKKLKLGAEREFLWSGNYFEMLQWLGFALKVNFLGFSNGRDVIAEGLARMAAQAPKASPSQTG